MKVLNGQIIIFPTDTVYGLGAKLLDDEAQERIMALKKRNPNKRFAVLCANIDQIMGIAYLNDNAIKLIKRFMPGALTVILKSKLGIVNHANNETIAVRIPNHKVAIDILKENGPMATTSVNFSTEQPLNDYIKIKETFGKYVDYVFDDPYKNPYTNVASTIVDLTGDIKIIREGEIKLSDILEELGKK